MRRKPREELVPDLTPLIDIVFILLIFFIVSSVFKKDEVALLLQLPKVESGQDAPQKTKNVIIELNKKEMRVNGKKMSIERLESLAASIANKETPIDLRIDKKVTYDKIAKIMDIMQKNGLHNVALITKQK